MRSPNCREISWIFRGLKSKRPESTRKGVNNILSGKETETTAPLGDECDLIDPISESEDAHGDPIKSDSSMSDHMQVRSSTNPTSRKSTLYFYKNSTSPYNIQKKRLISQVYTNILSKVLHYSDFRPQILAAKWGCKRHGTFNNFHRRQVKDDWLKI